MPADAALVVIGIVVAFGLFGVALAWADFYSRDCRKPPA